MLRDELFKEMNGDISYMEKIGNWLNSNEYTKKDFHTNIHDSAVPAAVPAAMEVSNGEVHIYSCLYDDLIPDKLSINEFRELLLQWIESSKP